jgi:spore maturation protein CgeB
MNIVILGLSITSSWGNGHATTYRALIRALHARGHRVLFLECDKPWYAENRDMSSARYCDIALYEDIAELQARHALAIAEADLVILGSYVPEGVAVAAWVTEIAGGFTAFYDIDTPVTMQALEEGTCEYLGPELIPQFDAYLSFTGGPTLGTLQQRYGAKRAVAFHCSVDPEAYRPLGLKAKWDLAYLGTYSADRQPTLDRLLVQPAALSKKRKFAVAGSLYPEDLAWPKNVARIQHLPPKEHCAFYNQQRFTLNVTREAMVQSGYSPSVRLFEAAACGTPIISDAWAGLETFLEPGREILIAKTSADVTRILETMDEKQRIQIGSRARARILREHTAEHRAQEIEALVGRRKRVIARPTQLAGQGVRP